MLTERGAASLAAGALPAEATSGLPAAASPAGAIVEQWLLNAQLLGAHAMSQCEPACCCDAGGSEACTVGAPGLAW